MKPPYLTTRLSMAEYQGIEAAHWSLLKEFERTALHARHAQLSPDRATDEMNLGQSIHAAVLEPGRFERDYIALEHWLAGDGAADHAAFLALRRGRIAKGELKGRDEKPDEVTLEGKALWAAFRAANPGRSLISAEDFARIRGAIVAVRQTQYASALLYREGHSEVSGVWLDEEAGVLCKIRMDRLTWFPSKDNGRGFIVDLKTGDDAARFKRTAANLGYHGQAAMYLDGARAIAEAKGIPPAERFVHVVVETKPPHGVRVIELGDDSIAAGRALWRKHLATYAECVRTGAWPGYPDVLGCPEVEELPRWALGPARSSDDFD